MASATAKQLLTPQALSRIIILLLSLAVDGSGADTCPTLPAPGRALETTTLCYGAYAHSEYEIQVPIQSEAGTIAGTCAATCSHGVANSEVFVVAVSPKHQLNLYNYYRCLCYMPGHCSSCVTLPNSYIGYVVNAQFVSVNGDPHFVGARGTRFDFNGELGSSYCLYTDKRLYINALLDGYRSEKEGKLRSWIKGMAFFWRNANGMEHKLVLMALRNREAARGEEGFLGSMNVDGRDMLPPKQVGEEVRGDEGFVFRLASVARNFREVEIYSVVFPGLADIELNLGPEMEFLRKPGDSQIHFNLKLKNPKFTSEVHGLIGQTFRPELSRVARSVQYRLLNKLIGGAIAADGETGRGFLDGSPPDYKTTSLQTTDCKYSNAWLK